MNKTQEDEAAVEKEGEVAGAEEGVGANVGAGPGDTVLADRIAALEVNKPTLFLS